MRRATRRRIFGEIAAYCDKAECVYLFDYLPRAYLTIMHHYSLRHPTKFPTRSQQSVTEIHLFCIHKVAPVERPHLIQGCPPKQKAHLFDDLDRTHNRVARGLQGIPSALSSSGPQARTSGWLSIKATSVFRSPGLSFVSGLRSITTARSTMERPDYSLGQSRPSLDSR